MWLFLPKPTSASSAVLEASTSPSDSLCRRLAASAMWRSNFRQPQFWRRALRVVPWTRLLSGLTYEPSQADSTAGAWLEQFTVSPARTCLSQESKRALRAELAVDCSMTPCESFARLDASGCFLKTSLQFSLFPQDTPYSENLPKAGSMRSGFLFERPTLALRTAESACSSWPTARAEDSECCGNHPGVQDSLGGATRNWRTPNTRDHQAGGPRLDAKQRQIALCDQAENRSTPASRDWKGANSEIHVTETGGRRHMDQLSNQVEHSFLPAQPTESNGQPSSETAPTSRRRLNTKFVEWLQGLPEGWTSPAPISSEALETWLSASREHLRSLFSSIGR